MNHNCPGPGCKRQVPPDKLACPRHWYQVSPPVRSLVYRTWAGGMGAGTDEHMAAMDQAISEMKP